MSLLGEKGLRVHRTLFIPFVFCFTFILFTYINLNDLSLKSWFLSMVRPAGSFEKELVKSRVIYAQEMTVMDELEDQVT
jgi:hypothetical protein